MNTREVHQQIILGLIQTTVNRTFLDLERRRLFDVTVQNQVIDWSNIRTLSNGIDWLFDSAINSRREGIVIRNLITEVHQRAPSIYTILAESDAYDQALFEGIEEYSRHIKRHNITFANQEVRPGFYQTLHEQINFGILQWHQRRFQINNRTSRYIEYRVAILRRIDEFFQDNGANTIYNNRLITAQQDLCWCLFNYKQLPLYRTVLRDYIETVYQEAQQELQNQQLNIPLVELIDRIETYITRQCTHLHFNLEHNAALLITQRRRLQLHRRQNMTMSQNQLRQVLTDLMGQQGLNINQTYTRLTNALNNIQPAGNRELSLVKVDDFSGKTDEDPFEWIDQFERAATANRWGDGRLLAIAQGYLKGAAADWVKAATAAAAVNRITSWDTNGAPLTSLKPRMIEKFAPESKQNKWYQELMNTRQRATESVDDYSLRFQRLLRKVNVNPNNPTVPANLQVRMYLFGLSPMLTPLVSTDNPANLNAAIERARTVENGYNYTPAKETNVQETEIDELTKKIEKLTLHYADIASVLTAQSTQNNQNQRNRTRFFNQNQRNRTQSFNNSPRNHNNDNNGNNNNLARNSNIPRRREDRTCFNCHRSGHIARNCPQPRVTPRGNRQNFRTTREVHYTDLEGQDEYEEDYAEDEYEDEAEVYHQYEQEVYPITRSGQEYTPKTSFARTPIVDELDELRRNTLYNSGKSQSDTPIKPNKKKVIPAPIESLETFEIAGYFRDLPSGLSVGQAAHLSPKYRAGLQQAIRRSYINEANLVENDKNDSTAAKITLRINGKAQTAIIDSGAATSIITKPLLNRLGYKVDKASKLVVVTANGARTKSLGIVNNIPLAFGKIIILTSFQVLESKDEVLILGNEWLIENDAAMQWKEAIFTIKKGGKVVRIPVALTKTTRLHAMEESKEEYDDEYDESNIYYSDLSPSDDDDNLEYNPWAEDYDNPAVYRAAGESANKQNDEWDFSKDMHVGPLDHHQ